MLTTLEAGVVGFVLLCCYGLLYQAAAYSAEAYVLFIAYYILLLLPLGVLCYLFPALSWFEMGPGALLANCAKLAAAHLPSTIAMALLLYGALFLCLNLLPCIVVLPALLALLHSLFLEPIFRPYIQAQLHPEGEGDDCAHS